MVNSHVNLGYALNFIHFTSINGKQTHNSQKIRGDFSNWQPAHYILGDEWKNARNWQGSLSHIALYTVAISAEEAAARYELIKQGL